MHLISIETCQYMGISHCSCLHLLETEYWGIQVLNWGPNNLLIFVTKHESYRFLFLFNLLFSLFSHYCTFIISNFQGRCVICSFMTCFCYDPPCLDKMYVCFVVVYFLGSLLFYMSLKDSFHTNLSADSTQDRV